MTSAGGSSRLLVVCCCVSFVSVFLYCIGYVRLELEIRAYKERLEALERGEKQLGVDHLIFDGGVVEIPKKISSMCFWFKKNIMQNS